MVYFHLACLSMMLCYFIALAYVQIRALFNPVQEDRYSPIGYSDCRLFVIVQTIVGSSAEYYVRVVELNEEDCEVMGLLIE